LLWHNIVQQVAHQGIFLLTQAAQSVFQEGVCESVCGEGGGGRKYLEVVLLLGVGGVQAQGVEAEVTGNVGVIVVQLVEAPAEGSLMSATDAPLWRHTP